MDVKEAIPKSIAMILKDIKEELCEKGILALKNVGFPIEYEK